MMRLAQARLVTNDVARLAEFYRGLTLCDPVGSDDYAEHARIRSLVTDVVLEAVTQPWGNRAMMFHDPDGALINLFSRGELG